MKSSLKDIYNFVKIKLNFPEKAIEATQEQDLDEEVFKRMMDKLSLPLDRRVSTFSKGMRRF